MSPSEYDSLIDNLRKLPGEFKALVEKRIELFSLELGERVSNLIAHSIYRMTGVVLLGLGLILILFAASNFVGELLDNEGLGFVVVATPVLILGLMFFFRRPRSMVNATRDRMLSQFMRDMTEQLSQFEDNESAKDSDENSARDRAGSPSPEQQENNEQDGNESPKA